MVKAGFLTLQKYADLLEKGPRQVSLRRRYVRMLPRARKFIFLFPVVLAVFLSPFFNPALRAQDPPKLKEVKIQGNMRVEEEGIRLHIQARPGDTFDADVVERDVK